MDKLIKQFLDSSTLGQWLHGNNFGWLISERISTQSALLSALFLFIFWGNIYYLGLSIILYAPPPNIVLGTVKT